MILATTHLGVAIVIEASLGFLGVGIPPPEPTWGNMLSDALNAGLIPPWWLVFFPGAAITLTVLAFNLLGDGIRDLLDPRLRGSVCSRRPTETSRRLSCRWHAARWPGVTSRRAGTSVRQRGMA